MGGERGGKGEDIGEVIMRGASIQCLLNNLPGNMNGAGQLSMV